MTIKSKIVLKKRNYDKKMTNTTSVDNNKISKNGNK